MKIYLDEINGNRAKHFFSIYGLENLVGDSEKLHFLGDKNPRVCRYCLKTDLDVSFKMIAHVIPQFMGNKNLVSYFECDNCNALFSKYEDSFANFFGVTRTFAQIKGQTNKVPKFKDPKTGLEVFIDENAVQIIVKEGDDVMKIDEVNKSFELTSERPAYIPIHITKMMIKMGIALLKEEEIEYYEQARKFIQQSEKDEIFKDHPALRILGYFIPGPPKFTKPFLHLYKKKDKIEKSCFSKQLILFYGNYCFQITMPFGENDKHLQGQKVESPIFPLLIDDSHFEQFGKYQFLNLNFTSNVKKSGEEHKISFSFDNFERQI